MRESETSGLIVRLDTIGVLTEVDREIIRGLPIKVQVLERGQAAAADGDATQHSCLLISGFMHRFKTLQDGRRQILSFHVPGEIPDLQSLYIDKMDHTLAATVTSRVGFVAHTDLIAAIRTSPNLMDLLWRETLIDAAIFRMWMVMLGQRPAEERMSHLLCELYTRLDAIGHAPEQRYRLPLTQVDLADALGLSTVHTNRTLQELRSAGLIEFEQRQLTILDWPRLQAVAQFDPSYLHLRARGG